ncbi:hypothetical protein BDV96DRAFT_600959 [Lophiotrema nucula]|uniref:Uncharacterized protein n=1 Tax=Lophiotrema nucula TaxID=690887 RepID=A0A6A5Z496_9PLEO|nr:hypothetical protein BDV96DRAFT_600959 [Lophiotrema nucula]
MSRRDTDRGYCDYHQTTYVRRVPGDDIIEVVEPCDIDRHRSSVRTVPRSQVQERLHAYGRGFDLNVNEDGDTMNPFGGLQMINENEDQNRSSPRSLHHDLGHGGPGAVPGWAARYGYLPPDPYGRAQDHWELDERHIRERLKAEQWEVDDMKKKAISEYKDERKHVHDEIDAAISKHDFERIQREKELKSCC